MMKCPECNFNKTYVIMTRSNTKLTFIWRRRKCSKCNHLFSTKEYTCESLENEKDNSLKQKLYYLLNSV